MNSRQPPPTNTAQRSLRKFQSAHSLGASRGTASSQQLLPLDYEQRQLPSHIVHQLQHHQPHSQPATLKNSSPPRRHISSIARSPQRGRATSDAPPPPANSNVTAMTAAAHRRPPFSRRSLAADALPLDKLFRDGPPNGDLHGALESARFKILDQGIKTDHDGMSALRIYFWLMLLDAPILPTDDYLHLIHRGASPAYSKIRNDTFRTLSTDPLFRRRVTEASLIRLLNAVAWKLQDARDERLRETASPSSTSTSRPGTQPSTSAGTPATESDSPAPAPTRALTRALTLTTTSDDSDSSLLPPHGGESCSIYFQGMNVLAAPFLYAARSEAEAFAAFYRLLTKECPGYIRGAMDGVHRGLALVDKVLAIVDPMLSDALRAKNMSAKIYAFPSVLTLSACTPPLPQVLRLWDFFFAYGPHLNILAIVAQLLLIKGELVKSASPNKILRSFPPLQADKIKTATLHIITKIPDDVYAEIVTHAQ